MLMTMSLVSAMLLTGVVYTNVATAGNASDLRVAATVAPVHSLVSMVTDGMTVPELIIRPGASPHNYALKPSEARALNDADVVFGVGESLEPWMAKAVTTLAGGAVVVELGAMEGVERLAFRKNGLWSGLDQQGDAHHDPSHGLGMDPHLWLAPNNALIWLDIIANTLAEGDSDHAEDYRRNAEAAAGHIRSAVAEIEVMLRPLNETPYLVFHDAYQYFEHHFDLHPLGAISLSDAVRPGPAHLIDLKRAIAESGAVCAFAEPQFAPRLIDTVIEGSNVKKGILDPIGASLQPGAGLYLSLMRGLADSLTECLG